MIYNLTFHVSISCRSIFIVNKHKSKHFALQPCCYFRLNTCNTKKSLIFPTFPAKHHFTTRKKVSSCHFLLKLWHVRHVVRTDAVN